MSTNKGRLIGSPTVAKSDCEVLAERVITQCDALHLRHRSDSRCDDSREHTGVVETAAIKVDLRNIRLSQSTDETDIQANLTRVGLGRVIGHLDVGTANIGERCQGSLHTLSQQRAIGCVADVARGLTRKAQSESARRGLCKGCGVDRQQGKVFTLQRTSEADDVVGRRLVYIINPRGPTSTHVFRMAFVCEKSIRAPTQNPTKFQRVPMSSGTNLYRIYPYLLIAMSTRML